MKKRTFLTATVALIFGAFVFNACDNDVTEELNVTELDVQSAEDDAVVDDIYNDIDGEIDQELLTLDNNAYSGITMKSVEEGEFPCKVVTVDRPDSTRFPKVITIDYGEGCTIEVNGKQFTRKGKIKITINKRFRTLQSKREIEFIDFYVNDIKIEGTRSVINKGPNDDGYLVFEVSLVGGKVTFNDTTMYTRDSKRTRVWIRETNPREDSWHVTGESNGINRDGKAYKHKIVERLVIKRCADFKYRRIIVKGVVEITRGDKVATIDYGAGDCDDVAMLTIDDETKEIQVRNRYHKKRQVFKSVILR